MRLVRPFGSPAHPSLPGRGAHPRRWTGGFQAHRAQPSGVSSSMGTLSLVQKSSAPSFIVTTLITYLLVVLPALAGLDDPEAPEGGGRSAAPRSWRRVGSAVDHLLHVCAVALADDLDARGGVVELLPAGRRAGRVRRRRGSPRDDGAWWCPGSERESGLGRGSRRAPPAPGVAPCSSA